MKRSTRLGPGFVVPDWGGSISPVGTSSGRSELDWGWGSAVRGGWRRQPTDDVSTTPTVTVTPPRRTLCRVSVTVRRTRSRTTIVPCVRTGTSRPPKHIPTTTSGPLAPLLFCGSNSLDPVSPRYTVGCLPTPLTQDGPTRRGSPALRVTLPSTSTSTVTSGRSPGVGTVTSRFSTHGVTLTRRVRPSSTSRKPSSSEDSVRPFSLPPSQ